jgi:hypothetical protein
MISLHPGKLVKIHTVSYIPKLARYHSRPGIVITCGDRTANVMMSDGNIMTWWLKYLTLW